jgi:isoleucyl-tRNA synthetase
MARRSAQTSLYHLAEALCRWIAPILSFTAEEIWENVPGARASSVFLAEWYEHLPMPANESAVDNVLDSAFWSQMMTVRQQVNKALELQRADGVLRGSLDASVTLYADTALAEQLRALGDELRFVLITSEVTVLDWASAPQTAMEAEGLALRIVATAASSEKCERCWHRRPDVGEHAAHPTLCGRCVSNIEGPGEVRQFA